MTGVENYIYETRRKDFFAAIYYSKPIAKLYRREYKVVDIMIYKNAFHLKNDGREVKELFSVSLENMDIMAHLYASYQFKALRSLIRDEIKYHPYIPEEFRIELIDDEHNFFYSEETINNFTPDKLNQD